MNKIPVSALQTSQDLDDWYKVSDPWNYEINDEDRKRKDILLEAIGSREFDNVLDIGCGQGFITNDLPGRNITGIDVSEKAIEWATQRNPGRVRYLVSSIYDLDKRLFETYDLIVITGVLYPQYIGASRNLVVHIVDSFLRPGGLLISVHISAWYEVRFPYLLVKQDLYKYRDYTHLLEIYAK